MLPTVHGKLFQLTAYSDRPCLGLGMCLAGWESPPPSYSHCRFRSPAGQQPLPSFPHPFPPLPGPMPSRLDCLWQGPQACAPGCPPYCAQRDLTPASDYVSRPSPKVGIWSADPAASGWSLGFEERSRPGLGLEEGRVLDTPTPVQFLCLPRV